jgi:hypothetical protein
LLRLVSISCVLRVVRTQHTPRTTTDDGSNYDGAPLVPHTLLTTNGDGSIGLYAVEDKLLAGI